MIKKNFILGVDIINNIFIGMLLTFLNFNLDIGSLRIGLIPTFLGYIFMLKGLPELLEFSGKFVEASPYVKAMIVYSGIVYAADLFGMSPLLGTPVNIALGLLSTIVSLLISHKIIMGIKDIETAKEQNLNSEQLYSAWKLLAVFSFIVVYLLYLMPVLALIFIIAGFVINIFYLYIFNKTKNLYYKQNPTE